MNRYAIGRHHLRIDTRGELIAVVCARIAEGESKLARVYGRIAARQQNKVYVELLRRWADDAMRRAERYRSQAATAAVPWRSALWEGLVTFASSRLALRYAGRVECETTRLKFALLALLHLNRQAGENS